MEPLEPAVPRPSLVREGRFLGTAALRGRGSLLCPAEMAPFFRLMRVDSVGAAFSWVFSADFYMNLLYLDHPLVQKNLFKPFFDT